MICIIGTHGSGKTTLLNNVKKKTIDIKSFSLVKLDEVTRQCPFLIGKETNKQAQEWIFYAQKYIEELMTYCELPTIIDRCLIDQ